MKKRVLFAILSLCSLFFAPRSNAQGNLQFNRVINYNFKANIINGGVNYDTIQFCVPANKIWKIESCATGNTSNGIIHLSHTSALNYGTLNPDPTVTLFTDVTTDESTSFPIWLGQGYCGTFVYSYGSSTLQNKQGMISIIEFNVVP